MEKVTRGDSKICARAKKLLSVTDIFHTFGVMPPMIEICRQEEEWMPSCRPCATLEDDKARKMGYNRRLLRLWKGWFGPSSIQVIFLLALCPQLSAAFSASSSLPSVSVGFIGCGTIAKAIATGLATQDELSITSIAVSRRSATKSKALQDAFPTLVTVHDDNQVVVDQSDVVFLTVLPQQTSSVLKELIFDGSRHFLVSLVSTSTLNGLAADCPTLPLERISKVICLPSVAMHEGVSLLVPKQDECNPLLLKMLDSIGGCVQCETEATMNAMMVTSGLMGCMYGVLKNNQEWLVQQGVDASDASFYIANMYSGMMQDALQNCSDRNRFQDLIDEQTPGGLNEQALNNLKKLRVMDNYDTVMDALLSRLEGKSDGSIES